jgi:SAM-dependent methyltransferase
MEAAMSARLSLFYGLLGKVQPYFRGARMGRFEAALAPAAGARVLDLGGTTEIWNLVPTPLDITIVNLPGVPRHEEVASHHRFTFLDGDATRLTQFADNAFDVVFSNSVIEHVGGPEKERLFAGEVRRLAPAYWIQTPSIWFPLEAHTGLPFWWFAPARLRAALHRRWERMLPAWNEMVAGTTVLGRKRLRSYFPDAEHGIEWVAGFPKSYFAFRTA